MQVNIRYKTSSDMEYNCCAEAEVQGERHFGVGKTWAQAKENLLKKLNGFYGQKAPPPEIVDIKVAGEDMDTEFFPFNAGQTRKSVTENEGDYQEFRNSPQYPDPVAWKKAKEAASRTIEAGKV